MIFSNKKSFFIILLVSTILIAGCSLNPWNDDVNESISKNIIEETRTTSVGGTPDYFLIVNSSGDDLFEVDKSGDIYVHNYENCDKLNTTSTGLLQCVDDDIESDDLSLHLVQDNWNIGSDWLTYENPELDFNITKLAIIYYNASSIQVITGTGAGSLGDIQTYNNIAYNVTEVSSDFELIVNFTGITEFTTLLVRHKTNTDKKHIATVQIWDYVLDDWEGYGFLSEELTSKMQTFGVYDDTDHIQDGVVQVRFNQVEGKEDTHIHNFDWVGISKGFGTPVGQEVDPLSVHKDGATELTANWNVGAYWITALGFNATTWFNVSSWLQDNQFINTTWTEQLARTIFNISWTESLAKTLFPTFAWVDSAIQGNITKDGTLNSTAWSRSGTDVILSNSGDKVGIGMTPSYTLDVNGDIRIPSNKYILFKDSGHYIKQDSGFNGLQYSGWSGHLWAVASSIEKMRLTDAGKLGIGTSEPAHKLDVNGSVGINGNLSALNITLTTGGVFCYDTTCNSYSWYNGSCKIEVSPTVTDYQC